MRGHFHKNAAAAADMTRSYPETGLFLVFGDVGSVSDRRLLSCMEESSRMDGGRTFMSCSGDAMVLGGEQFENGIVVAVGCDSPVSTFAVNCSSAAESFSVGTTVASRVPEGALSCLCLTPGVDFDGQAFCEGYSSFFSSSGKAIVPMFGGMASSGPGFGPTFQSLDGIGGDRLCCAAYLSEAPTLSTGTGWTPIVGLESKVTGVGPCGEMLEIDGKPALSEYARLLGPYSESLPGAALLFPVRISRQGSSPVVRSVTGTDTETGAVFLAGAARVGDCVTFLTSSSGGIVEGAMGAAAFSCAKNPSFILQISCLGRRAAMGPDSFLEQEAFFSMASKDSPPLVAGFFSNGEFSSGPDGAPALHNQTIAVAAFDRRRATGGTP